MPPQCARGVRTMKLRPEPKKPRKTSCKFSSTIIGEMSLLLSAPDTKQIHSSLSALLHASRRVSGSRVLVPFLEIEHDPKDFVEDSIAISSRGFRVDGRRPANKLTFRVDSRPRVEPTRETTQEDLYRPTTCSKQLPKRQKRTMNSDDMISSSLLSALILGPLSRSVSQGQTIARGDGKEPARGDSDGNDSPINRI